MTVGFIKEVHYPEWLSNIFMVKKSNGKWRMCVDFKDLNQERPKDRFPLPRIDLLVNSTIEHELLSFLDAFSRYNQVRMAPLNQEKTLFVTDRVLYSYKVMSFGLKNTRATYQLLVNHMFKDQIWQNIKFYVKDMQMKSQYASIHLADLAETFRVLDDYSMKLNPTKCAFGVSLGKFLGFLVSHRGIEANHEKIQAII